MRAVSWGVICTAHCLVAASTHCCHTKRTCNKQQVWSGADVLPVRLGDVALLSAQVTKSTVTLVVHKMPDSVKDNMSASWSLRVLGGGATPFRQWDAAQRLMLQPSAETRLMRCVLRKRLTVIVERDDGGTADPDPRAPTAAAQVIRDYCRFQNMNESQRDAFLAAAASDAAPIQLVQVTEPCSKAAFPTHTLVSHPSLCTDRHSTVHCSHCPVVTPAASFWL